MLDRRLLAQQPETVRNHLERRRASAETLTQIDRFQDLEQTRKRLQGEVDTLRRDRKLLSTEIGRHMKAGDRTKAEDLKEQVKAMADELKALEEGMAEAIAETEEILMLLPNVVDPLMPDGETEEDDQEIHRWGTPPDLDFEPLPHDELGARLGILDFERAARMSGARFAVLSGPGAALERALVNFFLNLHTTEHGYREVMVPYIVSRDAMVGTGQLPKFEADLFKLSQQLGGQDAFLVPTAEVPVTNLHREEILAEADLPLRYCCFTPCFRAEAGSHGRDVKGLIRQHQFHKVELVQVTTPQESREAHLQLTAHAETCLQRLGLHYRAVRVCSGQASAAAAYQVDLEVWLPSQARFREISSCSNFLDYQARRLQLRYRKAGERRGVDFCHTMNGSGLAVGRTLVAILEQYQQRDGSVVIPEALRPWMGGLDHIPGPA